MQLHAIQKRHRELLDQPVVGTGSFATVYNFDATSVLKVTSCGVTQKLFDAALAKPLTWPAGLPEVKQSFGVIARDEEGVDYKGYLVERLFTSEEWETESRGARAVTNGRTIRRTGRKSVFVKSAEVAQLEEVKRLAEAFQPDPDLAHVDAQVAFALEMASHVKEPLRSGFLYMADFVSRGGSAFDLTTPDNLRLDCYGHVKLCDPASFAGEQSEPAASPAYVLCDIPESVYGFKLSLKPMAVRARDANEAAETSARVRALGLHPRVSRKLKEVQEHLQRNTQKSTLFGFPGAVRRIQSDEYRKAFFALAAQQYRPALQEAW